MVGETETDVPTTKPIPETLVELGFETFHASSELWPLVIADGVAVNDVIVGEGCATVAEHVVVATVEDASVPCSVIEYVPGATFTTCDVDVLPFPHKSATGATPPVEDAVHVMFVADGVPAHETASASAYTNMNDNPTSDITNELTNKRNCIQF